MSLCDLLFAALHVTIVRALYTVAHVLCVAMPPLQRCAGVYHVSTLAGVPHAGGLAPKREPRAGHAYDQVLTRVQELLCRCQY